MLFTIGLQPIAQELPSLNEYTFEQAQKLQKEDVRPYLIFIYTDWCRYCQGMKMTTFLDKDVIKTLNEDYYFVFLNAEEQRDIHFSGTTFVYQPTGIKTGIHELAEALGTIEGELNYPSTVILNARDEIVFQFGAYLSKKELLRVLNRLN